MARLLLTFSILFASLAPLPGYSWPDKPLRVIVAFPPGGMIDVFARTFQARLVEGFGQPVVVENRPGAGGTLAEALLAKSAADGYTMMLTADSPPANAHLYRKLDYDLFRDLAAVSMLVRMPLTLVVHPSVPATSLAELVTYARSRPAPLSYATTGSGTSNHLSMEVLKRLAGIDMTHVPYKGGPQVINDLVGGQVNSSLIALMLAAPHVRSGKVRAIALTGEKRSPLLPQVQTFAEAGFATFPPGQWCGLWLRAGTPPALTQRIHSEFAKAVRAPEVQSRLQDLGAETVVSAPDEFDTFVRKEHARIGVLVREHRISAD
jgi:tripartite-type tricarboxylate transporter receptor subunit TctC